jgi:cell division protein FtsB
LLQRLKTIPKFFTRPSRRAVAGLLVGAALFGPGLYDMARMAVKQRQLDGQLAALAKRKEKLASEEKRLQTDPGYMEGLIRSTFKMSQPGEYVVPLTSRNPQRTVKRLASQQQ